MASNTSNTSHISRNYTAKQWKKHMNGTLIKFENRYCHCNKKCAVRISESQDNPNKLYYCCKYDECNYFKFWMPNDSDFQGGLYLYEEQGDNTQLKEVLKNLICIQQQINEVRAELRKRTFKNGVGLRAKMFEVLHYVTIMLCCYTLLVNAKD